MRNNIIALVGALVVLALVLATAQSNQTPTPKKAVSVEIVTHAKLAQEVFNVCDQSRQEINGATEENCGAIQAATGLEYLCMERNTSPSNNCWVEYSLRDTAKFK